MWVKTAMIALGVLAIAVAVSAVVGLLLLGRFLARGLGEGTQADAPRRGAFTEAQRGKLVDRRSPIGPAR
jgi:hypothetical protein